MAKKRIGLRRGWEALTHLNPEDPNSRQRYVMALDRENTRTIDRRGGTVLHSSRTNPAKMTKLPDHLAGMDFPLMRKYAAFLRISAGFALRPMVVRQKNCLGAAHADVMLRGAL